MARNPLDPFALGIGRLCHAWADLEKSLRSLFTIIAEMPDPGRWLMVDCLDIRDVVRAIRIGAVGTAGDDNERQWAEVLVDDIDYADNTLRPLRNRYVHDPWWSDHRGVMRASIAPRIIKRQAFAKSEVSPGRLLAGDRRELRLLIAEVRSFEEWLWDLFAWKDRLGDADQKKTELAELLSKRPRRRFPLPPLETRPPNNPKTKQKPPPRS